jgi:ATP-dependent Clp protease protease subunit
MPLQDLPTRRIMRVTAFEERLMELTSRNVYFIHGVLGDPDALIATVNMATLKRDDKDKPIWVILNSPGGEIIQGFAVCDAIAAAVKDGFTVNVLAIGLCASMATAVLQSASRRYSWPNTQFLVHQAQSYGGESGQVEVNRVMEDADFLKKLNEIVLSIIANRTGMPLKELMTRSKKTDCWLTAEEAKSFGPNGLIDEIITGFPF